MIWVRRKISKLKEKIATLNLRIGYELGYTVNLVKPTNLKSPDKCPYVSMSRLERLYIRIFGIPDNVKQQQARVVFSFLSRVKFSSVLDVGCSFGHYAIRIARKYPSSYVVGIDIDQTHLNVGKVLKTMFGLNNLKLENVDVCSESLGTKYDVVLLLQVLEHLEDDKKVLKNIKKNIINDGGYLIITAPNRQSPLINWYKRYVNISGHFRDGYTLKDLAHMIFESGFDIVETKYLSGTIGQITEKVETYLKTKSLFAFALIYPFLYLLNIFDDIVNRGINENNSGIFIVARPIRSSM